MDRPVYVCAHRVNGLGEIDRALTAGANAIECDVREGVVDHDGTFPWSTPLDAWLERLGSQMGQQIALVYFDIKAPTWSPRLIEQARAALPSACRRLYVVASVEAFLEAAPLLPDLGPTEAFAVDGEGDVKQVAAAFEAASIRRWWFSYGLPRRDEQLQERLVLPALEAATSIRSQSGGPIGIAVWTLSRIDLFRRYLQLGVDTLVTDLSKVDSFVNTVAIEDGFRMADQNDVQFL